RIRVADDELDRLAAELSNIIGWVEQLSEVNVEGVEPMTSVVDMALPARQDLVTDGGYAERVTANAPQSQDGFFLVPKVIE
ncbi:MAG TPA: Asp-tRNA(Asn)/Glu-tRNA(Gln) amidotransferase subunit GatC, partial [Alphaproteobacteria bacterium]|nr:Asp-tRNA(Asn)/Glu-tRNA(Gln) amidotransferase subunit GatC [Alphaproteobacteria bacterium]